MKKVSIIIPVYGVELYLRECLDSVLQQSYINIEVLLIDDESPDDCPRICDEYAKSDNRIQVIHQKNRGAAGARNAGLDIASGEYICFIDSDDKVKEEYVEELVRQIEDTQSDIAICSYEELYTDRVQTGKVYENQCIGTTECMKKFLYDWSSGLIWNKLFKTITIGDIRFKEGRKIDDEFFTYRCVLNAKKIVYFAKKLYQYRMRKSGVMQSGNEYYERILEDRLAYMTERYDEVVKQLPQLKEEYLINLSDNLIQLWRESGEYLEVQEDVKEQIRKYRGEILHGKISIKRKYSFLRAIAKQPSKQSVKDEKPIEGLYP